MLSQQNMALTFSQHFTVIFTVGTEDPSTSRLVMVCLVGLQAV